MYPTCLLWYVLDTLYLKNLSLVSIVCFIQIYDNTTADEALLKYCGSNQTEWIVESNSIIIRFASGEEVNGTGWKVEWYGIGKLSDRHQN